MSDIAPLDNFDCDDRLGDDAHSADNAAAARSTTSRRPFRSLETRMTHHAISLSDRDEARLLFGSRDKHLREIRHAFDVDLVFRDGILHVDGHPKGVEKADRVIGELRDRLKTSGELTSFDVEQAVGKAPVRDVKKHAIELYDRTKSVSPRTEGQAKYVEKMRKNDLVFCLGPAGCGKTYLAVAMAINAIRQEKVRKIVLARPAVEAGEKLGFLPGDLAEKVNPFLRPLLDALEELLDSDQAARYRARDVVEVIPLAFMRGRTLNETFIILDEAQNTSITQMKMFLTRMGTKSQMVVTGDVTQNDLPPNTKSGLVDAVERLGGIEGIATVKLDSVDIVRHPLVRKIVSAYDDISETA